MLKTEYDLLFQFTHPGKGATANGAPSRQGWMFQFTHPGKGATLSSYLRRKASQVSIHAPWEGCDRGASSVAPSAGCFNSRTLGRVRQYEAFLELKALWFQFTHPGKGATRGCLSDPMDDIRFNSRTLGRVRPEWTRVFIRAEEFQFTHPGKGATVEDLQRVEEIEVSIHAPWEGCDSSSSTASLTRRRFQFTHPGKGATATGGSSPTSPPSFNSRTLGRVRLAQGAMGLFGAEFQFTHPGKGATKSDDDDGDIYTVSIHAPWEGCD